MKLSYPSTTHCRPRITHMNLPLRARRDIDGILTGIKASAVAHRMQRDVDPHGRIVATLEDYRWTYVGFAPGLTSLYQPKVAETVLSVVRVIEQAIAEKRVKSQQQNGGNDAFDSLDTIELSYDQIATALGLNSRQVLTDRIRKAITAGLIEITNPSAARSVRRSYRVLVSSQDVKANSGNYNAMPTPERVEELLSAFDAAPRDYPF